MAQRRNRVRLKGSLRDELPGGRDTGSADPDEQIVVSVLLRRGSKKSHIAEKKAATRLPRERTYLSRGEFAQVHGASAADLKKVRAFGKRYGLRVASEDRAGRIVKLRGTVRAFSKAFETELRRYEHTEGAFRCRKGALTIPVGLRGVILGVFGLDNRPQAKPHFRLRKVRPGVHARTVAQSYSPVQVAEAYAFPSGATGRGQCIALIELGGGYRTSDLASFFSKLGIPAPKVTAISVDGAKNAPTGNSNGPDGEVELDIEVAGATAPGAQIAAYLRRIPIRALSTR